MGWIINLRISNNGIEFQRWTSQCYFSENIYAVTRKCYLKAVATVQTLVEGSQVDEDLSTITFSELFFRDSSTPVILPNA